MKKHILFSTFFVFLLLTRIYAGSLINYENPYPFTGSCYTDLQTNDSVKLDLAYIKYYYKDTWKILSSPCYWQWKQYLTTGLLVAGVTSAYFADRHIQSFTQSHRTKWGDVFFHTVEPIGNYYSLPVIILTYAGASIFKSYPIQRASLLTLESYAITGLFVYTLKLGLHRHRPNTGSPYNTWDGPGLYFSNLSFPSGHSASAFAIMTMIAHEFNEIKWIPWVAYSLAGLTALSRVYENYHWTSDIIMGSAIGFFTARSIHKIHSGKWNFKRKKNKEFTQVFHPEWN